MRVFYTIICILFYIPFKLLYPTRVFGKKHKIKSETYVTVSNHLSWVDIIIVALNVPGFRRLIGKKELGKNPIVRVLAKWLGVILIDRDKVDISSIRVCIKSLQKKQSITIFPEGTRNKKDGSLQEVKQGAAMMAIKGNVRVLPIMIYRKPRVFRRNYLYIDEPFSLEEFHDGRLDSEKLAAAADAVSRKMVEAKEFTDYYCDNKLWKRKNGKVKAERTVENNQS